MNRKDIFLSAIVAAAIAPARAEDAAQPAPDARPITTGEIIVTAQRRAEAINDVGMAIQAFDAQNLEALRVNSVKDLSLVVPSFTVSQSYQGVPTYTMRGIGFNTINLSATSTVGTYVDEVAYAYPIMNTGPIMDLERVEVLKGPQGTLYGRNTTAGLINFVTGKPTREFEGSIRAEGGNYGTYNFDGHISGPIADGIQGRLAFRTENSDKGWQRSNSRDERLGEIEKFGIRGSLAIQPSDSTDIELSATWWQNKSDTVAGQGIGFTPATDPSIYATSVGPRLFNMPGLAAYIADNVPTNARQADWAPAERREADIGTGLGFDGPLSEDNWFMGYKLRIDQDLTDDIKLVSLTSYNEFKRDALSDWSGVPYEILLQNTTGRIKSFAEDLHIEGVWGNVDWLVGGYYANDRIIDGNRTMLGENANARFIRVVGQTLLGTPFNAAGYTPLEMSQAFRTYEDIGHIRTETWSVFANAGWQVSEQVKLNAGVRYTEDRQRYNGCSRDFNGNMLPNVNVVNRALSFQAYGVFAAPIAQGQCNTFDPVTGTFGEVSSVLDENNVAWRFSVDWKPWEDTLIYASVSRGAKAGTTPINAANIALQNAPVKQELLTAYEVGMKATLAEQALQANLAAFYYDYKDKQISAYFADPIYTALQRLDNVPKSEAYGVEGELVWQPIDGLTFSASALWLHTEILEYMGINAAGQPQDYRGASFIYSPKFQGSLGVIYDRPLTESLDLQVALNGHYQSKSNTIFEDNPLYKISSYGTVNGSVGVSAPGGRWSVTVWARNLFDKYYWSAVASNANVVVRFPAAPRTFGVTLGARF